MRGILRVIPSATSQNPNRIIALRQAPSPLMLDQIVNGEAMIIENFDTILADGDAIPCVAYCAKGAKEEGKPPNTWANLLWLQSVVRKIGFSECDPKTPDFIAGPVAILYGDQEFMRTISEPLPA